MDITRHELSDHTEFLDDSSFRLKSCPFGASIPLGLYELPRRSGEAHLYRMAHPLAEKVLEQAKGRPLPYAEITFDYGKHDGRITILESLRGKGGNLQLSLFTVQSLDQAEEYLILSGATDDGHALDEDQVRRFFSLPARSNDSALPLGEESASLLERLASARQAEIQRSISERNAHFFEDEAGKLEGWADDLKLGLEREIKELDKQIKEARRGATAALTLEDKLVGQKKIKSLEVLRNEKRRTLFDAQDQVDRQREELIAAIEWKLVQKAHNRTLFSLRWKIPA